MSGQPEVRPGIPGRDEQHILDDLAERLGYAIIARIAPGNGYVGVEFWRIRRFTRFYAKMTLNNHKSSL